LDKLRTRVYGQKMYRDLDWNFSFWRPRNWHTATLDGLDGVVVYPEDSHLTGFYVMAADLGEALSDDISQADLPALRRGLMEGFQGLPECEILSEKEITKDKALGFEFLVTFMLNGARCKQRLRILYLGRRQYTIYGQGTPPEEYDVFENIFDFLYMTFKFGDLLLDMGIPLMPDLAMPHVVDDPT
jgi:hypothetical protein